MSTPIIIPPGYDIIEEIVSRLSHKDKDYSGTLIVFPGKRPGHYVRKKLGSLAGSGFIPPRIMSMDDYIDYVYETGPDKTDRKLDSLDASALLFDIHTTIPAPVGGGHFQKVDDFLPLAMNIFKELEEIHIAGISSDRLHEILSAYDTGQIGALETYYTQFYKTAVEKKYSTRSMRYNRAADLIGNVPVGEFNSMIFAGFFVLTKSERDLFAQLLTRNNTTIIFQDGKGMQEHLRELSIEPKRIGEDRNIPVVRFHKSPDTHGQVFALSGMIKNLLDKKVELNERNVIVTPAAETLFPLIQQTLPLIPDKNYNISLGYPAARSTLHGFLSGIMDVLLSEDNGLLYAHDYLKFALHPYTKNILLNGSSEPSRILFHTLEEYFSGNPHLTYFDIGFLESDMILFDHIASRTAGAGYPLSADNIRDHLKMIHDNTIRPLIDITSIGFFAEKIIDIILFLNKYSTARQYPLFNHFSGHLIDSFIALQKSLLTDLSFSQSDGYFNFYNHYIAQTQIPFAGTPLNGLQVLGFLETRSLKFDRVFLLDANDDMISGMRRDESLMPTRVRAELGIPTYRDRERLNAYYLDLLIHTASEVDCFYIEKDKKERSRYLEQLAWNAQKSGTNIETDSVQYKIKLVNPEPPSIPKTGEIAGMLSGMKYSATSLDIYLRCPLRFFYRYVLKLYERDELGEDIDNLQVGELVHLIMKKYFTPLKGIELHEEDVSAESMNVAVDEIFRERYGKKFTGKIHLLRRQIGRQMIDFLDCYQRPIIKQSKYRIIDVETPLETVFNGYRLGGTIDRIEKRGNSIFILDFKISANADRYRINFKKLDIHDRASWDEAIGSLQLVIYSILFENNLEDINGSVYPVLVLLGKQRLDTDIDIGLFDTMNEPAEDMKNLKTIVKKLLDEINDPEFDFHPTKDYSGECPNCPYKLICGTQWAG